MPLSIAISGLDALSGTDLRSDDLLPIVDVHDTTEAPTGTTKKITQANLFTVGPFGNGTVAAPSITFASDLDSGLYRIGANNIGLALNGAKVVDFLTTGITVTGIVTGTTFSGSGASLTNIPNSATTATSANTASAIVARDGSGNFSAGTITASLTGSISGNAATATALQTARTIWGQSFDGTGNVSGALSGATTIGLSGAINSTATGSTFAATGASTSPKYANIDNTTGSLYWGVNGSSVGGLFSGSSAYSGILGTNSATDLSLATNGIVRFTIAAASSAVTAGTYNGQTISSSASFTGTLAVADTITSTKAGLILTRSGASTSPQYGRFTNTSGDLIWGVEDSSGNNLFAGTTAYDSVFGSVANKGLSLATNNTVRVRIDNAGAVTMSSTLGVASYATAPSFRVGGITSGEPGIFNNGTTLRVRLADDSGYAPLEAGATALAGTLTMGARIILNSATFVNSAGSIQRVPGDGVAIQGATGSGHDFAVILPDASGYILGIPTGTNNLQAYGRVLVDSTTDATSTTNGAIQSDGGGSFVKSVYVGQDVTSRHLIGNSGTPGGAVGGATIVGTGATITITGTDTAGVIQLDTGSPVTDLGTILTLTFNVAYSAAPYVVLANANSAAAAYTGDVYATATTTTFTLGNTNSNLTGSTTYKWYYAVIA